MKKRLLAKATTGKTKFVELETEKDYLITRWGYVDGKQQETQEKCEPKNVGKTNATTGAEQAILEFKRKVERKKNSGYTEEGDFDVDKKEETPDLSALQKEFCPCKPIAKPPKDALTGGYLAERKYNGVNIVVNCDENWKPHIYTRRIDDITDQLYQLEEIKAMYNDLPASSMILVELIYVDDNGNEVPEKLRALINKRRSPEAVKERYDEISKTGKIVPIVFDIMFWENEFYGDKDFLDRREEARGVFFDLVPDEIEFNQEAIASGKRKGWEGFILRKPDGKIAYTMNGKAKRTGSWKWKYEETDDFVVIDAEYGKGKHDKYFARFKLAQYDHDGAIVECGWCGPGRLKITELQEIYDDREENGKYRIAPYMVVEIVYRVRTKESKLEFPVLQRIRDDKKHTECVFNGN